MDNLGLNYDALTKDPTYLEYIDRGVWLMDDHRWALKVWEVERRHDHYTLIHADYHWDGCYDFDDQSAEEAQLIAASSAEVAALVAADEWIRYDSFIAPAIRRHLIHTVHFYCLQHGPGDDALPDEFLAACGARQFLHDTPEQLAAAQIEEPFIFDLCLDLFNRAHKWGEGDLWPDSEIVNCLETFRSLIAGAELVTISMSFNDSGAETDTRHLTKLVVPIVLGFRS
jgi:hypothetical protein